MCSVQVDSKTFSTDGHSAGDVGPSVDTDSEHLIVT
jgi:hypothetical protein